MKMPKLQDLDHYEGIEGLDYTIEYSEYEQAWEVRGYFFYDKEWLVVGHFDELGKAFWEALDHSEKEHRNVASMGGCKRDDCLWCKVNVLIAIKNKNIMKRFREKHVRLSSKTPTVKLNSAAVDEMLQALDDNG